MNIPFLNIVKANAEIARLEGVSVNANKQVETLTAQITADAEKIKDYEATIEVFPVADYQKLLEDMKSANELTVKELTEKHAAEMTALKETIVSTEVSANKIAWNIVASIGIDADMIPTEDKTIMTPQEALTQFNALSGVEKTTFYNTYSGLIHQAMK